MSYCFYWEKRKKALTDGKPCSEDSKMGLQLKIGSQLCNWQAKVSKKYTMLPGNFLKKFTCNCHTLCIEKNSSNHSKMESPFNRILKWSTNYKLVCNCAFCKQNSFKNILCCRAIFLKRLRVNVILFALRKTQGTTLRWKALSRGF